MKIMKIKRKSIKPKSTKPNYRKIAEAAYESSRKIALKAAKGRGYDRTWNECCEAQRIGFTAFVKFVARELNAK